MPASFPAPEIVEEEPSNVPELLCDNLEVSLQTVEIIF